MSNPFRRDPDTDFEPADALSEDQARRQIEQLREAIEFHDRRYYVDNDPVVSDRAYDTLFRRLETLEDEWPQFDSETSPTRRVGAEPVDELEEVEHTSPMLSLDAAFDREEIAEFDDYLRRQLEGVHEIEYFAEPKFDGLSIEVVYENGEFSRAATRGDGYAGEDVTENVKTIRSVPMHLDDADRAPDLLAVRGEIYMSRSGFQELNKRRIERGDDAFANPRNAAAGTIRQLDPRVVDRRPLDVFFYDLLDASHSPFASQTEVREAFDEFGLRLDPHAAHCETVEEVADFWDEIHDQREDLDYELDGVVVKVDDFDLRERLGVRSRSPRWAIAWKFPAQKEVTTLSDIAIQVGRTGKLTPVALLDPVDVDGVTVSRASLHNIEELHDKDVRPGDTVRIQRAGDVIPEVVERVETDGERDDPFEMPDRCPVCDTEVVREGPLHYCPAGLACRAQLEGHLVHYGSRGAMDIEGLGEKTVAQLVHTQLVEALPDLYELSPEDLMELELFAEKSANNLCEAIQEATSPRLDTFLFALGIRHVGDHVAELIAEHFLELAAVREASVADLEEIDGIGPEIARSVSEFFDDEQNARVVDRLLEVGVEVEPMPDPDEQQQPLEGLRFVFTGALDGHTRAEAQEAVEALGARSTSSVSGVTDYLVAGENPGSTKLGDAEEEGVEILDEEGFEALLEEA